MTTDQLEPFKILKQEVQMQAATKLGIGKNLIDWSLQDIRDFQADLEAVCKSSVSEKWVYTHFKNQGENLPRIDVLNLLAAWIGYKNWDDFLRKHATKMPQKERKVLQWVICLAAVLIVAALAWLIYPRKAELIIVFKDAYTQAPIEIRKMSQESTNQTIASAVLFVDLKGDTLLADGPYYKQKRILLPPNIGDTLIVEMLPDDYALMLNFFSRSTADDLDKRRLQLMDVIHPEAKIFQSHPQFEGIELLNREEFIDRLILPINSLKNLEIQHIIYQDEMIYRLQFLQKTEQNEIN